MILDIDNKGFMRFGTGIAIYMCREEKKLEIKIINTNIESPLGTFGVFSDSPSSLPGGFLICGGKNG